MSFIDKSLEFADALDASGGAGRALIGDVLPLQEQRRIGVLGNGQPMYLVIVVTTAFSGGTSVNFELSSDDAQAIATDGSATVNAQTGPIAIANLTAGTRFNIPLPLGNYEEYLGVIVNRVGTVSAGEIDAFLTHDVESWVADPDALDAVPQN